MAMGVAVQHRPQQASHLLLQGKAVMHAAKAQAALPAQQPAEHLATPQPAIEIVKQRAVIHTKQLAHQGGNIRMQHGR